MYKIINREYCKKALEVAHVGLKGIGGRYKVRSRVADSVALALELGAQLAHLSCRAACAGVCPKFGGCSCNMNLSAETCCLLIRD